VCFKPWGRGDLPLEGFYIQMKVKVKTSKIMRSKKGKLYRRSKHRRKVPPHLKKVKYYDNRRYVATGLDSKGRVQYIYPEGVKMKFASQKYKRINRLKKQEDELMGGIIKDAKKGDVEAQAVYTMYKTGFRPGSGRDTKSDVQAFGTTTLLKKHVRVRPNNRVKFKFVGKKGVKIEKEVKDKLLSDVIKERKNDQRVFETNVNNVRSYFKRKTSNRFQLKDLRTLKAFDVADKALTGSKLKDPKKIKKEVVAKVAEELGNTPSIAASAYIAPKLDGL